VTLFGARRTLIPRIRIVDEHPAPLIMIAATDHFPA
jgi:hypothetical protein